MNAPDSWLAVTAIKWANSSSTCAYDALINHQKTTSIETRFSHASHHSKARITPPMAYNDGSKLGKDDIWQLIRYPPSLPIPKATEPCDGEKMWRDAMLRKQKKDEDKDNLVGPIKKADEMLAEARKSSGSMSSNEAWRNHRAGHKADPAPDRFELFLLGDGEEKVTQTPDTRVSNCVTFHFKKEDHTLGNLLRSQLLKDPDVLFSAYRVPHPMFPNFDLRVQTNGNKTPQAAVIKASQDLIKDLGTLRNNFTREWELRRMVDPSGN